MADSPYPESSTRVIRMYVADWAHRNPGDITLATDMRTDLGFDDTVVSGLVLKVGRDLGVAVSLDAMARVRTVGDLADHILAPARRR